MYATIDNDRIAYDMHGTHGPAIVLMHGMGDFRESWDQVAPMLVDAGYRVIQLDSRGHGESGTSFADYSPEATTRDVLAVLDAEGIRAAHLVGNSYTGATAVLLAARSPERVLSITLSNPFVHDMPADQYFRPLIPFVFARPWGPALWGMYYKTLLPTAPEGLAKRVASRVESMREPGRMEAMRAMGRASKAGVEAELGNVHQRALMLMGGADPDYTDPEAEGQWIADHLGGQTDVVVIADVGHYPHVERPQLTAAAILKHVGRNGVSSAA